MGPLVPASTAGPPSAQELAGLFLSVPDAAPLLRTGVVTSASTYSRGTGTTTSPARVAGPDLTVSTAGYPELLTLTADAVTSTCTSSPEDGTTGDSDLAGLALELGLPVAIAADAAPNTTINLGVPVGLTTVTVARLVLNEQTANADGSLTVNARKGVAGGGKTHSPHPSRNEVPARSPGPELRLRLSPSAPRR